MLLLCKDESPLLEMSPRCPQEAAAADDDVDVAAVPW